MDNQTVPQQVVEPTTGSSVIVDPPKVESDQAGELLRKAAEREKHRPGWMNKFSALPKKQRRNIIMSSIFSTALIIIAIIAASIITAVNINYADTYRVAKELRVKIQAMRSDYDCQKVLDYVDSPYTTMAAFAEYVEGCRTVGDDSKTLVETLGLTDAVKKDENLTVRYDSFNDAYQAAISGGEELNKTLDLYTIWHQWVIASAGLENWDQTDTDLDAAAKILIDSGDDILKSYGEGWLNRKKAVAKAYRDYYFSSMENLDRRAALQKDMETKQKEFTDYEAEYRPNIKELDVLETADTAKLYARFEDMYEYIRKSYQEHYERGSNDCRELLTEVVCD